MSVYFDGCFHRYAIQYNLCWGEVMESFLQYLLVEEELADEEDELMLELIKNEQPDNIFKKRRTEGAYEVLIKRHLSTNQEKFREYFRLTQTLFDEVLSYIRNDIATKPCNRHTKPITPEEKLCITLRFLATGESYRSLAFQFRINHSWISVIVKEVLQSICRNMINVYLPQPTEERFKEIAKEYYVRWNYPNCCGAIDGKHIRIKCPSNSGSLFFNYKTFHSVVLLAIVDANYKYVAVDIGSYGREGDAGIFRKSNIGQKIANCDFHMLPESPIPNTNLVQPHVILGDEAFALTQTIMKPYPKNQSNTDPTKAIYNYRHSRARRTTENTFGIMCQYFRIFFNPIPIHPETTDMLILSACILHNMLRHSKIPYPGEYNANDNPALPTNNLLPLNPTVERRPTFSAHQVRETFKHYFNSPMGTVSWQKKHINRTQ